MQQRQIPATKVGGMAKTKIVENPVSLFGFRAGTLCLKIRIYSERNVRKLLARNMKAMSELVFYWFCSFIFRSHTFVLHGNGLN